MSDGMTSISADDEIGAKIAFALRSFRAHAGHVFALKDQVDNFVLHAERKRREAFRLRGEKVQEIPLRHESNELAARRQTREVRHRGEVTIKNSPQLRKFLMRQFQEFVEQSELVHELERGRMNGVAAKIAIEIGVLF